MNCRPNRRLVPLLALMLSAGGCGALSKPYPDKSLHALDVGQPPASSAPRIPLTLRLQTVRVAMPFDASTFTYKTGDSKFASDYYSGFVAPPARLLTGELSEWLSKSGPFTSVIDGASSADYQLTLETNVTALYGDYTPGQSPSAVIEARFFVVDSANARYNVILQKTYRQIEPIAGNGPDALVEAWQKACHRMFAALTSDLQTIPAPSTATAAE